MADRAINDRPYGSPEPFPLRSNAVQNWAVTELIARFAAAKRANNIIGGLWMKVKFLKNNPFLIRNLVAQINDSLDKGYRIRSINPVYCCLVRQSEQTGYYISPISRSEAKKKKKCNGVFFLGKWKIEESNSFCGVQRESQLFEDEMTLLDVTAEKRNILLVFALSQFILLSGIYASLFTESLPAWLFVPALFLVVLTTILSVFSFTYDCIVYRRAYNALKAELNQGTDH